MNFYRDESSDPKYNAQRNLSGRTHYTDDDTLRYFKSRILSSGIAAGGLLFWLVESVALDPQNRSRGYRHVIFDLFGTVLSRSDLEHTVSSSKAAQNALRRELENINAQAHTLQAIEKSLARHKEEMAWLKKKVLTEWKPSPL